MWRPNSWVSGLWSKVASAEEKCFLALKFKHTWKKRKKENGSRTYPLPWRSVDWQRWWGVRSLLLYILMLSSLDLKANSNATNDIWALLRWKVKGEILEYVRDPHVLDKGLSLRVTLPMKDDWPDNKMDTNTWKGALMWWWTVRTKACQRPHGVSSHLGVFFLHADVNGNTWMCARERRSQCNISKDRWNPTCTSALLDAFEGTCWFGSAYLKPDEDGKSFMAAIFISFLTQTAPGWRRLLPSHNIWEETWWLRCLVLILTNPSVSFTSLMSWLPKKEV